MNLILLYVLTVNSLILRHKPNLTIYCSVILTFPSSVMIAIICKTILTSSVYLINKVFIEMYKNLTFIMRIVENFGTYQSRNAAMIFAMWSKCNQNIPIDFYWRYCENVNFTYFVKFHKSSVHVFIESIHFAIYGFDAIKRQHFNIANDKWH